MDVQFVTASISTALVLLLLGMVTFIILTAGKLSVYIRENLDMSLLLADGTTQKEVDALIQRLDSQPYSVKVTYISKEDILTQETQQLGLDPTDFLGFNPYTASVEVRLKSEYANGDSIALIRQSLSHETFISEISYPTDLVDNINGNIRKISVVLFVLAVLLGFISFALINNTIKLTIYSQRFLLHTMKLVGAEWSFIRRPFMVRNFWVGLSSGLLALCLLGGGLYALIQYEPKIVELIDIWMLAIVGGVVLLFGILITLFCAHVSLNRFLRMKASDLYYK